VSDPDVVQPLPPKDENLRRWLSDWRDEYGQEWTEEQLGTFGGKKVHAERPAREGEDGPKGIVAGIVGYSIDTLCWDGEVVHRYSLVSDEGISFPLFTGMTITVVDTNE
jgi:hypothetical protein